jgi:hypothetical protein
MGRLHPFNNGTSLRICPAPCFYTLCLLSCPLVNTVSQTPSTFTKNSSAYTMTRAVCNMVPLEERDLQLD